MVAITWFQKVAKKKPVSISMGSWGAKMEISTLDSHEDFSDFLHILEVSMLCLLLNISRFQIT